MIINKMKSRIKILSPIFLMVIFLLSIQIDSSNAVNIAGNKTNLQAQVDNFPQTFYQTGTSWLNFTFMAFAASNPQANVLISYIPSSTEDIYCREITIFLDNHQVYSTANTAAGMICGTLQTGEINLASYISSTSYNTYHNIQMRLTYGGYGYSWQITNIQLTGGNFEGLTLYSSSGVPFSPGQAELDTSGSTSFGGQCIPGWCANTWTESLASSVEAPRILLMVLAN